MIKVDVAITDKRVGERFLRVFNYYEDDGVTPSNPTSFAVKLRRPDGTEATYTTGPEVVISGNDHIISIALTQEGDTYIEVVATWSNEVASTMFYLYVTETL